MGSNIGFYASNTDQLKLETYARSIDLYVIGLLIGQEVTANPADGPGCNFSKYPEDQLHPFGEPPIRLTPVRDPMLSVFRAYYKDAYLVLGQVHWNNDDNCGKEILPYYRKIQRWIRKNWIKYGDFYMGPEAATLVENGAERVNFLPENKVEIQYIDTSKPYVAPDD